MKIAWLRHRFPAPQAIGYVFSACILTIQAWEFYNLFREIPALRYRETTWDLIGIISIVQVFALFESCVILLALTALAIVLPASWFRQRYVAQATALLIVSALLAVSIHTDGQSMTAWTTQKLWFWLALYILAVIAAWLVIQRYQRIEQGIKWVVQRTVLLSQVYVAISLLGLVVILIRNL
jgi:hypothetical protein